MKVNSKTAASLFFRSASLEFVYFEAIANSIDSGSSDITVAVDIDSFSEPESLKISILDNGKGFDDENYSRFCMLLEKVDAQHKGLGRLIFLEYFSEIKIKSSFGSHERRFTFSDSFDGDDEIEEISCIKHETSLELSGYRKDRIRKYDYISYEKLKVSILHHFLPRLYQLRLENKSLRIRVATNTKQNSNEHGFFSGSSEIFTDDLPTLSEKSFPDDSELLARFKVLYSVSNDISKQKSIICAVCADSRTIPIKIISEDNMPDGYQMIFILYSDFFNGKTNVTREAFTYDEAIDKRVKRKFTEIVSQIIKDEIPSIQKKNDEVYQSLQNQYPHLVGYFDQSAVGLWDKASVVESAQYQFFADQKDVLEATDLTDEQYQKSLSFSSRILTEYILYRSKILHKLRHVSSSDHENEIHGLLVPKGKVFHRNNQINDIFLNNAWVLDDKYMSYSKVLSDVEIERIYTEIGTQGSHQFSGREAGRPDITVIFSRDPEEIDAVDVVIIELKKLDLSLHKKEEIISQLKQRARRLLEFYPGKIQRIWFYGIIDFDDELIASLLEDKYTPLFSEGTVYYKKQPIIISLRPQVSSDADIFLLSFETMLADAEIRNQTFLRLLMEGLKGNSGA
jgi:hypothetical protein